MAGGERTNCLHGVPPGGAGNAYAGVDLLLGSEERVDDVWVELRAASAPHQL